MYKLNSLSARFLTMPSLVEKGTVVFKKKII